MFSSKHTYLLHQEPPNSGASTSMVNEILLQDMLSGHYPVTTDHSPPPVLFNHDLLGHAPNGDPSSMAAHMCHKSTKKDRHSKIHTAQGPRDRRVRLSIGVARKFFDLQEMLGFDKPSKTLDWLLTKSKSAIRHLVHTKHPPPPPGSSVIIEEIINNYNCNNFNDDDGFVEDDDDVINNNNNNNKLLSKKKGKSVSNKKSKVGGYKDAQQQAAMNQARESRVKARARARERTREKMCIKQQQMYNNEYDHQMGPVPIQYMNNQLQEVCRISASGGGGIMHHYDPAVVNNNDDLIEESNVIKRKQVKHNNNPSIFGFHPALPLGYNNDNNWDITNFSSQSSLCAILDQHKFNNIHSSSNNN